MAPRDRLDWRWHSSLALIFLLHATCVTWQSVTWFPVVDEPAHLAAGVAALEVGEFGYYSVNPPVTRMVAAAVPVLMGASDGANAGLANQYSRPEFAAGCRLFENNRPECWTWLIVGRLSLLPFSLLGALVAYRWADELSGVVAARLAFVLWCLLPDLLAHGSLLTPDATAASVGLGAGYCFYRWRLSNEWRDGWIAILAGGAACLVKYTWLVLFAAWPLLILVELAFRKRTSLPTSSRREIVTAALATPLLLLLVVNCGFGFQNTLRPLGDYEFYSKSLGGERGSADDGGAQNRFQGTALASLPVPVPEPLIRGVDLQRRDFENCRSSYLRGERSETGWLYYYIYGFLVKSPVGFLGLCAASAVALGCVLRHGMSGWPPGFGLCAAQGLAVLVLVSSQTGMSLHYRYLLPALGFLLVAVSVAVVNCRFWSSRLWRGLIITLAVASGAESLACVPHSLSFCNLLAGGPANCHFHLIDSGSDWGQDLMRMRDWQIAHPEAAPLFLATYTSIDPRLVGLEYSVLPRLEEITNSNQVEENVTGEPRPATDSTSARVLPGWYAISTDLAFGTGSPIHSGEGRYVSAGGRGIEQLMKQEPVDRVGWSLLIFHVEEDASRRNGRAETDSPSESALHGDPDQPLEAT
jgi:hypothetical protein